MLLWFVSRILIESSSSVHGQFTQFCRFVWKLAAHPQNYHEHNELFLCKITNCPV